MPLLTEEMKLKDMEQISEFLNELEIPAEVMKAGGWFDRGCVLIGLPTEEELDWDESLENLPEDVHIVCGFVVQLDQDSEEQLTKYFMMYAMIPTDLSSVDEVQVLELVNQMNKEIALGTFFYDETTDYQGRNQGGRVQFRHNIGVPVDGTWDEGVVCEAILELGVYYDIMKERLEELVVSNSDKGKM